MTKVNQLINLSSRPGPAPLFSGQRIICTQYFWEGGRKEAAVLMCHTNGIPDNPFLLPRLFGTIRSLSLRKSIVARSEIINTGFHNQDTLRHKHLKWVSLRSQPGPKTQIISLRIYGAMEIVPRCVALRNVWCMMHPWSMRWPFEENFNPRMASVKCFSYMGGYRRGVGSKMKCLYV